MSFKLSKNYAVELGLLRKVSYFKEQVTFCDFDCGVFYSKSDHNPKFVTELILFNILIFEFSIYNINHVDFSDMIE